MIRIFIKNKVFLVLTIVFCIFVLQNSVLAERHTSIGGRLSNAAQNAGFTRDGSFKQPTVVVGQIINITLGLLGLLTVCLIVYAGYLWMTASGNDDQLKKAKGILTNSIIGLIIVLAAYIISSFVVSAVIESV